MLSKAQHFRYSFLHGLSYDAHFLNHSMVSLITVAVQLDQYEDLYSRLREIDGSVGRSHEQRQQLDTILNHVLDRDSVELIDQQIKLQDLSEFAQIVTEALSQCGGTTEAEHAVLEQVRHLLAEGPVAEWKRAFARMKSAV